MKTRSKRTYNISFMILILLVSFFIVLIWFKDREFIAGGESGLWLFNAQRTLSKSSTSWTEYGTGLPIPSYLTRIPALHFAALLQKIAPPIISQMVIYYLLIISGIIGMYFLAIEVICEKRKDYISLLVALFYFFNIYTMSQVWNRLLYPSMFAWSYLPWFLFLWMKAIEKAKLKWYLSFLFVSIVFSNTFSIASYLFALWMPAYLWLFVKTYHHYKKSNKIVFKYIIRGVSLSILWMIINLWWLYPQLIVGSDIFTSSFSFKHNFDTLVSISKQNSLLDYLFLRHGILTGPDAYGGWYQSITANLLVIFILSIFLYGIFKVKKVERYRFLIINAIISFFIIKGSHPPLGFFFYKNLFHYFPQAGILRNPYEKFGIVWLLSYSFFFGLGLTYLLKALKKINSFYIILAIVLPLGYLVWPLWNGSVYQDNVRINIPAYYDDVNNYFKHHEKNGRILINPMLPGGSAKYDWGYGGVEISDYLYDKPTISSTTGNKYVDKKYNLLKEAISKKENFHNSLEEMNIRYLIIQDDYNFNAVGLMSTDEINRILKEDLMIEEVGQFGSLTLYEFINSSVDYSEVAILEKGIEYTIQKKSPVHYTIYLKDVDKNFNLIFKSTYNSAWIATSDDKLLSNHYVAYDYANGWRVDKVGDYSIDIVFKVWPWQ